PRAAPPWPHRPRTCQTRPRARSCSSPAWQPPRRVHRPRGPVRVRSHYGGRAVPERSSRPAVRAVTGFDEDELVAALRRLLSGDAPGVRLGPGDDAALVDLGPHLGILTADLMVEDVHFRLATTSPRDLGYKSLAVNVSDVAAMGGSPRFALVSLGLPVDTELGGVVELYGGVREAADEHAMAVVGGDTSRAARVLVSVGV